jgi:hypothetical protein
MNTDQLLERLATEDVGASAERAPARLKSRIYSALVNRLTDTAEPLLSLPATKASGIRLCVFEEAVAALPMSDAITSKNPCRVCHARLLGEHLTWAPIFWPGCPYSEFHNG